MRLLPATALSGFIFLYLSSEFHGNNIVVANFPVNVEMEVVLPGTMTVAESHDIALALQHKIEEMDDVERAFVHVDHLERDGLEHKVLYSDCVDGVYE
jgi:divalent metal cation (Fe/Co/Zn/Cd) transporter